METLAGDVLVFLASDPERLATFLAASGLQPETLRTAVRDRSFQGGLLDHVMGDDELLKAFAAHVDRAPEAVGTSIMRLRGGQFA